MKRISRTALLPYSAQQMYDLVNNVPSYPEFLPWCIKGEILQQTEQSLTATVHISKGPIKQAFTTRNHLSPGRQIDMALVDGPFKHLQGKWCFTPLGEEACKISFDIEYEVAGGMFGRMLAPLFEQIASTLVDAFSERARKQYGKPKT